MSDDVKLVDAMPYAPKVGMLTNFCGNH
uniref:Uncharacterized protein n=1 Tax=Nelumbo nucifera TaxID=4432 RepID=A0A822Y1I3_NELNU|nr:TPA_asm: hypothetical protein HUJ06_026623 [Nelumbo nucifera]